MSKKNYYETMKLSLISGVRSPWSLGPRSVSKFHSSHQTVLLFVLPHQTVACDTYDTNWCCDLLLCSPYLSSPLQFTLEDIVLHMAPWLHRALPSWGFQVQFKCVRPVFLLVTSSVFWKCASKGRSHCQRRRELFLPCYCFLERRNE